MKNIFLSRRHSIDIGMMSKDCPYKNTEPWLDHIDVKYDRTCARNFMLGLIDAFGSDVLENRFNDSTSGWRNEPVDHFKNDNHF